MTLLTLLGSLLVSLSAVDGITTVDTVNLAVPSASVSTAATGSGGYDAITSTGKRKRAPTSITREDAQLTGSKRTKLQATSQDLAKNFAIAGWMIRRHLDYVALFDFQSRCATDERLRRQYDLEVLEQLDRDVERLMEQDSTRYRFDAGARCHREKFFRLAEMRRTVDGDLGIVKLRSGNLQAIESDCIRDPSGKDLKREQFTGQDPNEWVDGVHIGSAGSALEFAVHRRGKGGRGYELDRIVPAANMIHYGYFNRFASDQTRGVSPIVAGLNSLRDCYEGVDYALAKMKVSQLFATAIYSQSPDAAGEVGIDEEEDDEAGTGPRYKVDFGNGPVHLELDGNDRAEFLESRTPSTEMQSFCTLVIGVGLKALDIPYSFYDEGHTNFFGSRGAWLHYERAALDKRDDQIQMRRDYTNWKLRQWVISGRLQLPPGMSIADLATEWVPRGMPWWDPAKEIRGDKEAVGAGFDNPERICKRTGHGSVYDNLRTTMQVLAAARKMSKEILGDEHAFAPDYGVKPEIMLATEASDDEKV